MTFKIRKKLKNTQIFRSRPHYQQRLAKRKREITIVTGTPKGGGSKKVTQSTYLPTYLLSRDPANPCAADILPSGFRDPPLVVVTRHQHRKARTSRPRLEV